MTVLYSNQTDMTGEKIPIHHPADFEGMRRAGRLAAETLDMIGDYIKEGVSTAELDAICRDFMLQHQGIPATIGYKGYRHATCISVNRVVTHGIPSDSQRIEKGDILNIDVTPIVDGWHGDSSRMFVVGKASVKAKRLVTHTYEAMMAGIETVRPGVELSEIGRKIEAHGRKHNLSTVKEFCGHGLGRIFHTPPQVLHYWYPGPSVVLEPGMFFTIEPMFNLGKPGVKMLPDGWTVVTKDRSWSAQFEHSLGVTEDGYEIFTTSPRGRHHPYVN